MTALFIFRRLFKEPDVTPAEDLDLKWEKPDEEGLVGLVCSKSLELKIWVSVERLKILSIFSVPNQIDSGRKMKE